MKHLLAFFSLAIIFAACSDTKEVPEGFKINGKVADLKSGTVILMKQESRSKLVGLDTAQIQEGKFLLEGKVEYPQLLLISFGEDNDPLKIFVENAEINVELNTGETESAKISGSKSHSDYEKFISLITPFDEQYKELKTKFKEANAKDDTAAIAELEKEDEKIFEEKNEKTKEFVKSNPSSFVSPYIVRKYLVYYLSLKELEDYVNNFDTTLSKSDYYQLLSDRIDVLRKVDVGQVAPDFTINDSLGQAVSLSDFKGKYVLIDFWASWCGPCRAENPNVVKMYNKYHENGFEIFGVSFDSNRKDWIKAVKEDKLTWTHVSELKGWDNAAGKLYGVMSIPHTVLVDKDGKIIAKGEDTRGEKLEMKLEEIFK